MIIEDFDNQVPLRKVLRHPEGWKRKDLVIATSILMQMGHPDLGEFLRNALTYRERGTVNVSPNSKGPPSIGLEYGIPKSVLNYDVELPKDSIGVDLQIGNLVQIDDQRMEVVMVAKDQYLLRRIRGGHVE